MISRSGLAFGLAVALLIVGAGARADEELRPIADAIALGPSRCLDLATLAEHVGMWLQKTAIDRRLAVEIADAPNGVRFVVRRDGVIVGERTLEVARVPCQEIHAAVGLGIASAIDATILGDLGAVQAAPSRAPPVLVPTPSPVPSPPPIALQSPPPRFVPPIAPVEPSRGPVLTVALQGMIVVGVLPRSMVAITPSIEVSFARGFDLRASALVTGRPTITVGTGTAETGLVAGRLDACAARVLLDDVARLRACVGVLAGAVNSQGGGFAGSRTSVAPWIAPALRVDGRWSLTRAFGLFLGVDGYFPVLKPELQVLDPAGRVVAAEAFPLAGIGVSLGPSLTF